MYALRHIGSGNLCGFRVESNGDAEFCGDNSFTLTDSKYVDNVWVVRDKRVAEKAAINTSEWYNAEYETPTNPYVGSLEVVRLYEEG